MKITWFGGPTFRLQLGGQIVVVGAEDAPEGVDLVELLSGTDLIVGSGEALPQAAWDARKPRKTQRILEAGEELRPVEAWSLGHGAMVLDGEDERPLVLASGGIASRARWLANAVVVLAGEGLAERGMGLLEAQPPRLIALAGTEAEIELAFAQLPAKLGDVGLVALEPGLAIEV